MKIRTNDGRQPCGALCLVAVQALEDLCDVMLNDRKLIGEWRRRAAARVVGVPDPDLAFVLPPRAFTDVLAKPPGSRAFAQLIGYSL